MFFHSDMRYFFGGKRGGWLYLPWLKFTQIIWIRITEVNHSTNIYFAVVEIMPGFSSEANELRPHVSEANDRRPKA